MQKIVDFDLKYLGTYDIIYSVVTLFSVLLCAFWDVLDPVLEIFFKDITIKQFLKLLALFSIIFFQNSIFGCQKYPRHLMFDHFLFFLSEYRVFVKEVLANSIDKNTNQNILICTALPQLS